MDKSRAILFSIVFQLAVGMILLDYHYNPLLLQSNCLLAYGTSDKVQPNSIVDCIACHYFTTKDLENQFIGRISIFVPLKSEGENGLNSQLSFDSLALQNNNKKQQFSFLANVFSQNNCSYYECSSLHVLDDFKMNQKNSIEYLNKHKIQRQNNIFFSQANISLLQISYPLGIINQGDAIKLQSNSIVRKEMQSLIVRVRYPVSQKIEEDRATAILLYQLKTGIYVRFILILVVLLHADKLLNLMAHFKSFIKVILLTVVSLGFISLNFAIVSSFVAIYLTLAKIYHTNSYGIIIALIFLIVAFTLKLSYVAVFIITYTIIVSLKRLIDKFSFIQVGTLIGIINTTIYMWIFQWQFFIYISPVLLLSAILSTQQQSTNNTQPPRYNLINVDQQQDVLFKIKKQLS